MAKKKKSKPRGQHSQRDTKPTSKQQKPERLDPQVIKHLDNIISDYEKHQENQNGNSSPTAETEPHHKTVSDEVSN